MREPDLKRAHGCAWLLPLTEDSKARGCLRAWVLDCPGVHLAWGNWLVSLCHLRVLALPGAPEPVLHYRDAAYELMSAALDPRAEIDLSGVTRPRMMAPIDFAIQFHGITDEVAIDMVDRLVGMACSGVLPPDTDYRERWRATIWHSIEHVTTGHPRGHA